MKFSLYFLSLIVFLPLMGLAQFETQFDDGRIKIKRKTTDFTKEEIVTLASRETVQITLQEVNEAGIVIDDMYEYTMYLFNTNGQKIWPSKQNAIYSDTLEQGLHHIYLQKKPRQQSKEPSNDSILRIETFDINNFGEAYLGQIDIKQYAHNEFKIKILHSTLQHLFDPVEIQLLKPVIYLYSDQELNVSLDLKVNGELTFTYPEYNNGWQVQLDSSGITHQGKSYPYLFWEGEKSIPRITTEGFCVEGKDIVDFLEKKLTEMNFNATEKTDFITFWAPRMQESKFLNIHFVTDEDYENIASLDISPKPDNLLRIFMVFEKSDAEKILIPQVLPYIERNGFSLLEWGGGEITNNQHPD